MKFNIMLCKRWQNLDIFTAKMRFLTSCEMGDFKNNASISLINVYRLSKADLLLKLILRYVINVFLASCQVSSL